MLRTNLSNAQMLPTDLAAESAEPSSGWPPYGAHVWSSWVVGSVSRTVKSDTIFREWCSKADVFVHQGRYPTAAHITPMYDGYAVMKTANPNLILINYNMAHQCDNSGSGSQRVLGWEVILQNGQDETDDWIFKDTSGFPLRWNDANTPWGANVAHQFSASGSVDANFAAGWARWYQTKQTQVTGKNLFDFEAGTFWDGRDHSPNQGNPRLHRDGEPTIIRSPDYDRAGDTDNVHWRQGHVHAVDEVRTVLGSTYINLSNGARDDTPAVKGPLAPNPYYGLWDGRLAEHVDNHLEIENPGDNTLAVNTTAGVINSAIDRVFRRALICRALCDSSPANRIGKAFGYLDFAEAWQGSAPTATSDVTQPYFEAMRFMCGLACLDDRICAGMTLQRGNYGCPYPDEYVYDPGDPIGSTPSIGSIDETAVDIDFTRRAADSGVWWWKLYENVGWFVNLADPDAFSAYPGSLFPADLLTLPSAGAGNKWQFPSSTYTNTSRTDNRNQAEDQSPLINTGADVGSTLNAPRWTARMLVKVAE